MKTISKTGSRLKEITIGVNDGYSRSPEKKAQIKKTGERAE